MFSFLKNLFSKSKPSTPPVRDFPKRDREEDFQSAVRRWDSAETSRLNAQQWCGVGHQPRSINRDLYEQRQTLVSRCRHERYNNPMVEGLTETYAIDVMGEHGPRLVVESDNEEYNETFAQIWQDHFSSPGFEVTGLTGQQLLQRLIIQDFTDGDWVQQIVSLQNELPGDSLITTRLLDIDPERLKTPYHQSGDYFTTLGVRRDKLGRPTQYYVAEPGDQFANWDLSLYAHKYRAFNPDDLIHTFYSREAAQVRGFPRLASVLQEIADLRDYDNQVLDAVRAAANNSFLLWTEVPEFVDTSGVFEGSFELERQTAKALPPGYKATQMTPAQPVAQYIPYRHEKLRSLGRIIHMPLLSVLLSADGSNFSQSRIDLNVLYERGLNNYRAQRVEPWLMRLVRLAERELMFATGSAGFVLPRRPADVRYSFFWQPLGQANPKDYVAAQEKRIELGLTTYQLELSRAGLRQEEVIESRRRTNEMLEAAGLPPMPAPQNSMQETEPEETSESNDNNTATAAS